VVQKLQGHDPSFSRFCCFWVVSPFLVNCFFGGLGNKRFFAPVTR
jgi:hypothetical protein